MKYLVTYRTVFPADALADPVRRAILERLADGEVGAGEIAADFPVSRPAISRHLRILREAGLVTSRVAGQHRIYRLDRRPLAELDAWLQRFRPLERGGPASRLDALDTEMRRGRRARRAAADARAAAPAADATDHDADDAPDHDATAAPDHEGHRHDRTAG